MFRGVANLNLDVKGRMAIPARYREQLMAECDGQLVVTVDRDRCLLIYPLPEWENIEQALVRLPSLNPQARKLQRLLIGHATETGFDSQGRILIPTPLREFASLGKKVVLIGQGRRFELWDEQGWSTSRDGWLQERSDEELELPEALSSLSF
ncbi:MAG: division/cell wall cluster transcriptional repressor MraZ [Gammaproteobacteria bacterium]|nr:division/cell wall cluster transcriptional repressor MraZ [Gammaproteobacteria bacterium]